MNGEGMKKLGISETVDDIILDIMPDAALLTDDEVFERLDSLELFDLIFNIEERFGITVEDSELDTLTDKSKLVDLIYSRVATT